MPHSTLHLVQIFFDTATFDNVEKDKKIKTEAQLSLIGGTMGLLTGFSIISGIEIIFFLFRLIYEDFEILTWERMKLKCIYTAKLESTSAIQIQLRKIYFVFT